MQLEHICVAWAAPDLRSHLEDISNRSVSEVKKREVLVKASLEQIATWATAHFGYELYNRLYKGCIVLPLSEMTKAPELQEEIAKRIGVEIGLGFGAQPEHAELAAFQALKRPAPKRALYHPHMQPEHQQQAKAKDPLAGLWQQEAAYVELPLAEENEDYFSSLQFSASVNPKFLGKSEDGGTTGIKGYQPMASAQDGEVEALRNQIKEANELQDPVEATHAAHDFLNILRSRAGRKVFSAQVSPQQLQEEQAANQGLAPEAKHRIKMALSEVQAHAPELEKLKDTDPSAYNALMRLIQAIADAAKGSEEDLQKAENQVQKLAQILRSFNFSKAEMAASQPVKRFTGPELPAGTIRSGGSGIHGKEGTVKIQHANGKTDWVSARSGLTQSGSDRGAKPILGSSGHAVSTASRER